METSKAFIFDLELDLMEALPSEVLFLPSGKPAGFQPFRVGLSKATSFPKASDSTHRIVKGFRIAAVSTAKAPPRNDLRRDFRVSVIFDITLQSLDFAKPITVSVENLSAGGLLFISKEDFEIDTKVGFSLPIADPPVRVAGIIVNKISVNKKGYNGFGVRFHAVPTAIESIIRKYIFEQQMAQIRRQREREGN